jgi:galactonate dehydratase
VSPDAESLRIARVRAVAVPGLADTFGFVRVWSEDGSHGTGELIDAPGGVAIVNDYVGPAVVGRNALDVEAFWHDMWSWSDLPGGIPPQFVRGQGGPFLASVGAVEVALWDLAGKAVGVPVHRLLGGKVRDRVPVYLHGRTPDDAARAVAAGATIVKCRQGFPEHLDAMPDRRNWTASPADARRIAASVATIREAIGDDIGLAVDCLGMFDAPGAVRVARALEPLDLLWLEEPTTSDNADLMADVRRRSPVPIAAGENIYTRHGFRPFLERHALDIAQPDPFKTGGLLETRKIAAAAEVYRVPVAPHGVASPLGMRALIHLAAAIPNLLALEWAGYFDDRLNALAPPPPLADGYVAVDDGPGLGAELDEERLVSLAGPWDAP